MPYSNGCMTVLSNFEAQQNYQDVTDPSVIVTFPLANESGVEFLAWTTTPWTLPSNLALSVNPEFTYVQVMDKKSQKQYIVAKCRLGEIYKTGSVYKDCEKKTYQEPSKKDETEFSIVKEFKGKELKGIEYVPLFDYYHKEMAPKGCFKVLLGGHVTDDAGTGIVHTAPAFGAEDYHVALESKIIDPDNPCVSVDDSGCYIDRISDYKGKQIKAVEKDLIADLKTKGRLFKNGTLVHSYPMCWRSETPLIYKAVHCWFIKVTDLKEKLLENNLKSTWVPQFA